MDTFFFPHPQTYITYASMARPRRPSAEQRWKSKAKALERWENEGGRLIPLESEVRGQTVNSHRQRETVMS